MLYRYRLALISLIMFLMFANTCALFSQTANPGNTDFFLLKNSIIIHVTEKGASPLRLGGDAAAIFQADGGVYYVRHDGTGYTVGFYSLEKSYEFRLKYESGSVERLVVHDMVFYILFMKNEKTDVRAGELVRFNPDSGKADIIGPVSDFCITGGRLCLIKEGCIDYNGSVIPLMIEGSLYFKTVIDERMVFVSNGSETEICDIVAGRNLYQYSDSCSYYESPEYNLMMEFSDTDSPDVTGSTDDSMVYYSIIINGEENSRTETAPDRIVKTSYTKLKPGKIYLVRAERWELDRLKEKYVRMNNIMQPGELRIFIPENRVVRIRVEFDGETYRITRGVCSGDGKTEGGN